MSDEQEISSELSTRRQLIADVHSLSDMCGTMHERLTDIETRLEELVNHIGDVDSIMDRLNERDVSIWTEKPRSADDIPPFIPIQNRLLKDNGLSTRFVSFINLKGGVGKTTLCANLAAAFATGNYRLPDGKKGKPIRVLVLDLDFQATLSIRCVSEDALQKANRNHATVARLLNNPPVIPEHREAKSLASPFIHCPQMAQVSPADDQLDAEDFRRQAKLALGLEETRFAYRNWFHTETALRQYDLVLFDCPPRMTTSTVCSMTASDYLFIPTSPDIFDMQAVNRTLRWIGTMRKSLDLPMRIGGIIFNRTAKKNELGANEKVQKNILDGYLQEALLTWPGVALTKGDSVVLQNNIPKRAGANDSINGRPSSELPGETKDFFADLATEIYERIY